jgi:hypothetical protein
VSVGAAERTVERLRGRSADGSVNTKTATYGGVVSWVERNDEHVRGFLALGRREIDRHGVQSRLGRVVLLQPEGLRITLQRMRKVPRLTKRCASLYFEVGSTMRVREPSPLDTLTMRGWAERSRRGRKAVIMLAEPKSFVLYVRESFSRVDIFSSWPG